LPIVRGELRVVSPNAAEATRTLPQAERREG
jgi:hypothetical protein